MTADEEAAYVREVAEQKTAALRMSLDAVERQGMPFVGESGRGRGGRQRDRRRRPARIERRTGPACRPTRPGRASGRGAPPGGRAPRPRRAARPAPREDAAMTAELVPAVGGQRTVPAPDPIARDYLLLALRLDQHIPGLVDGYFGPADLKAQVDMEQLRAPARLRDDAAALRDPARRPRSPEPDRRAWLDAQLVALETQAAGARRRRAAVPRPRRRAASTTRRAWIPDERFDAAAAADRRAAPRRRARSTTGWRPGTPRSTIAVDRLPGGRRLARRALPRRARPTLFGLPDGEDLRVSLVRDQPWGALQLVSTAAAGRGSTSTRTCPSAPRACRVWSPTRRTPAITSSTPGRRPSSSIGRAVSSRRSCSSTRPSA